MPTLRKIGRLPKFRDMTAAEIDRANRAAKSCIENLSLRGYSQIDTPILEETELFLRKSGGELSSKLYHFEEPGRYRTSLRPEFTAPVIRYAIEKGEAGSRICRYQYFGPVFRYASPENADGVKTRQFNQLGAELIGAPAARADGEVIAMSLEGLKTLQLPEVTIALGHVGLLKQLLKKFQLSEWAIQFLLSNAEKISSGDIAAIEANAKELGLLSRADSSGSDISGTPEQIKASLEKSLGKLGDNAGSRTREDVIARLVRKQTYADAPANFQSALSMLSELMAIKGDAASSLNNGRKLASEARLDDSCFVLLEQVIEASIDEGVPETSIDIRYGLARGVAYYTGMVFDLLPGPGASDSLGGGGRYDGLTKALGLDEDVPALGFAYNFDEVVGLLNSETDSTSDQKAVLVKPRDESAWKAAAKVASEIRSEGKAAVVDYGESSADEFESTVIVDTEGNSTQERAT